MTREHLLVTGFGPFPGMPRNPSESLARQVGRLGRHGIAGFPVRTLVLRTSYAALPEMLEPALAENPAAVLMIGVAGRAKRVRVEARALNRVSRLFPDASGRMPAGLRLDRQGPDQRVAPLAARALVGLRRHGVAAISSVNAGRYLCNANYFRALAEPCPVLFLHIPPARPAWRRLSSPARKRRDPLAVLPRAVAEMGRLLLVAARGRHRA
ncbi:hypothetical protein [Methylobacterium sp. 77]|uniref:pyroglutamyl-peptidase I family protein n=1 Tax=Methylobacterium sp. 77 TaxID=1101192 RepID=UPI00037B6570|nr:hypothetical protein [Methylobacterium sp. 77]